MVCSRDMNDLKNFVTLEDTTTTKYTSLPTTQIMSSRMSCFLCNMYNSIVFP